MNLLRSNNDRALFALVPTPEGCGAGPCANSARSLLDCNRTTVPSPAVCLEWPPALRQHRRLPLCRRHLQVLVSPTDLADNHSLIPAPNPVTPHLQVQLQLSAIAALRLTNTHSTMLAVLRHSAFVVFMQHETSPPDSSASTMACA